MYRRFDDPKLTERDMGQKEVSNMYEYMVEQGALHTIPLFFLLSGYIGGLSSLRGNSVERIVAMYREQLLVEKK